MRRRSPFLTETPALALVATPIGNLSEVSERTKQTLSEVDVIGAEDTRVASFLLNRLSLPSKKFIKVEKHNEAEGALALLKEVQEGKKVAYVSDAGYPGLSDPGEIVIKTFLEAGLNVYYVNGPSALLPALLGSGLPTDHFYYEGFLPSKGSDRRKRLEELKDLPVTMVYYEAPHRLYDTLSDMLEIFGNRQACLARELTKIHEEYLDGSLEELKDYAKDEARGEYVIVVEGKAKEKAEVSDEEIRAALLKALQKSRGKEAVKETADFLGINKKRVYALYLELPKD